uniref:Uncharacterized protein n=1 Tax=viral metagenome TaxID=1070528 RepID=A0A6C0B6S6_9ZZZZ
MSYSSFNQAECVKSAFPTIKETVPKSSLGYNTNNKYPEFPPLMADGRAVTASYQPESVINNDIIMQNNIKSNWEYRQYLIKNAEKILEQNFRDACNDSGSYVKSYEIHNSANVLKDPMSSPHIYGATNMNESPFGYSSSDLKTNYLSREQLTESKGVNESLA